MSLPKYYLVKLFCNMPAKDTNKPPCDKPVFCLCKKQKQRADQLCSNRAAISGFVFAIEIVKAPYFLNPCEASSHLLWLYRPVCVGPGQTTRRLMLYLHGEQLRSCSNGTWVPSKDSDQSVHAPGQIKVFIVHSVG